LIVIVLLAGAAAAAGLIATGSFGAGDDSGARQVFDRSLGGDPSFKSGRFSADLDVKLEGAPTPQLERPVQMQMSGAFDQGRSRSRPKLALDATMTAIGQAVRFGVTATGQRAFVSFGANNYAVPQAQLSQLYSQATPPGEAISVLGFDPRNWLKDATDEGDASIGGVETHHVSANVDTGRLIDDLIGFARRTQPAGVPEVPQAQLSEVKGAVKHAHIDLYTGRSDGIPRRLAMHATVRANDGSGKIDFDMTFSEVNKPQRITAPASTRPFSQLQNDLQSGGLGLLAGQGSVARGSVGSTTPVPSSESGAAPATPSTAQAYLGCVRRAASRTALAHCQELLP
jgi:hypothetical protein